MGDFEIYDDDSNSDNDRTDDDGVTESSYQRDVEREQTIDAAENASELLPLFRQNRDDQGISPGEEMDQIVLTKCGHVFHKSCISGWIGGVNGKVTNKKALQIEDDIGHDENVVPYVAKI
eukprot:scaffold266814_cov56-Attheya_sp.AAC.3